VLNRFGQRAAGRSAGLKTGWRVAGSTPKTADDDPRTEALGATSPSEQAEPITASEPINRRRSRFENLEFMATTLPS
jgi:hypothetical protein